MQKNLYLPQSCRRCKVFVAYSRESPEIAREIVEALRSENHQVFFDEEIRGGPFNPRIRDEINECHVFVIVIDNAFLDGGRYIHTEVEFALSRLPPNRIIPVIVDSALKLVMLEASLRSTHVIQPGGNIPAKVAAAVDAVAPIRLLCKTVAGICAAAVVFLVGFAVWILWPPATQVSLIGPSSIDFRTLATPPPPTSENPMDNAAWLIADTAITAQPLGYRHSAETGKRARIIEESASIYFGGANVAYRQFQIVDLRNDALPPSERTWLSAIGGLGVTNIEPGTTLHRELMFKPGTLGALPWKNFVDQIQFGAVLGEVVFVSTVEVEYGPHNEELRLSVVCQLNLDGWAERIQNFVETKKRLPYRLGIECKD